MTQYNFEFLWIGFLDGELAPVSQWVQASGHHSSQGYMMQMILASGMNSMIWRANQICIVMCLIQGMNMKHGRTQQTIPLQLLVSQEVLLLGAFGALVGGWRAVGLYYGRPSGALPALSVPFGCPLGVVWVFRVPFGCLFGSLCARLGRQWLEPASPRYPRLHPLGHHSWRNCHTRAPKGQNKKRQKIKVFCHLPFWLPAHWQWGSDKVRGRGFLPKRTGMLGLLQLSS